MWLNIMKVTTSSNDLKGFAENREDDLQYFYADREQEYWILFILSDEEYYGYDHWEAYLRSEMMEKAMGVCN